MNLKNISLNIYSFGYYAGFINDPNRTQKTLDIDGLVHLAKKYELGGVEFPFDHFYNIDEISQGIENIKEIQAGGLSVFIDLEKTDVEYIVQLLPYLSSINIEVVRIKMDQIGRTIYGGNRYTSGTFDKAVKEFKQQLSDLLPTLKKHKVVLAIENHQDLHSTELVEISSSISQKFIGVTWDVGNSLSMADSPDSFYKNTKHIIKNVHLKDYKVCESEAGVQLLRCPLGEGYVNYKNVLKKLTKNQGIVNMSIEIGAQNPRECDIDNKLYWKSLSNIKIDKSGYLDFVGRHVISECLKHKKIVEKDIIKNELQELERSVHNLKQILGEVNDC